MVLNAPGQPLSADLPAHTGARPRPTARPRARVRRVPHRPAHRRRRAGAAQAAADPGPRDRRHGRRAGRWRTRLQLGDRVGVPVARLDLRRVPLLPARPGEPLRRTPASPATRSTAATPSTPWPTQRYCFRLPDGYDDAEAAPLLCAGLIGYRVVSHGGRGVERLGIYGFGAAAHIVAQVAVHQGARSSPSRARRRRRRRRSRAGWARSGPAIRRPCRPEPLDAAIIFAPVGALVPAALRAVAQGRRRRLRRHPHERHPVASPTHSCGGSASCARWPT